MEPEDAKVRRLDTSPGMSNGDIESSDASPGMSDGDMSCMNEVDRKILASAILGVDITEIFSPERMAKVAREYGLVPGSFMDLTTGLDSTRHDHGRKAWRQIKKEDPYLIVGSPPCTWFSVLMELNVHMNKNNREWQKKYEELLLFIV